MSATCSIQFSNNSFAPIRFETTKSEFGHYHRLESCEIPSRWDALSSALLSSARSCETFPSPPTRTRSISSSAALSFCSTWHLKNANQIILWQRMRKPKNTQPRNANILHNSQWCSQLSKHRFWHLLWKRAHQDDSNDTPQPICECQVNFPLLWIKDYPGLS